MTDEEFLLLDIKNRAETLYNYFIKVIDVEYPERRRQSTLEFVINDSKEINGRAWCEIEKDHIEINRGVINLYYSYFSQVLEYQKNEFLKKIMPNVDENRIEEFSYEMVIFENQQVNCIDNKVVNSDIAKMLETFVSRFIILHELGHIFDGHCFFLSKIEKEFSYMPMYFEEENDEDEKIALDFRTLEMDADAFAVTQSIVHVVYLYENFESEVQIKSIEPIDLFYWWSFAIRSHFLVCEDKFNDHQYKKSMKHLPSLSRWNLNITIAYEIIENSMLDKDLKKKIHERLISGAKNGECVYNEIKYTNYNWINEIQNNKMDKEYVDEVNANWKKIRDELDKYSRLMLAYVWEE